MSNDWGTGGPYELDPDNLFQPEDFQITNVGDIGPDNLESIFAYKDTTGSYWHMVTIPMCPDLVTAEYFGAADTWRGRVIKGFFWLMRWWKP
jgi:hypothetical protein